MSAITDSLTIAVASGGALTTLVAAVRVWARAKSANVVINVRSGQKSLKIEASNISSENLHQILRDITTDLQEGQLRYQDDEKELPGDSTVDEDN
jgi:hypothetical protein